MFIELGDYQTLLRPTAEETEEEVDKKAADVRAADQLANVDESTATFIIPAVSQNSNYGEDTLRAMAVITEKFDSFRRRQLRVKSFMKTRSTRTSRDSGETSTPRCSRDNSMASRSNSTARRRSRQQRIAADHQLTVLGPSDVDDVEASEGGQLTAAEVERVRLFFSSLSTVVVVCRSLADLFVGACTAKTRSDGAGVAKSDSTASCGWVHVLTGVPTLVLNTGACSRRRRELSLVVADRGTGFPV